MNSGGKAVRGCPVLSRRKVSKHASCHVIKIRTHSLHITMSTQPNTHHHPPPTHTPPQYLMWHRHRKAGITDVLERVWGMAPAEQQPSHAAAKQHGDETEAAVAQRAIIRHRNWTPAAVALSSSAAWQHSRHP